MPLCLCEITNVTPRNETQRCKHLNGEGLVNAIDAAVLAAHFGATLTPPGETTPGDPVTLGEETPTEPLTPGRPVVVDATPFIGPLPVGGAAVVRQPISPVQRQGVSGATLGFGTEQRGTEQRMTEQGGTEQGVAQQRAYALRSPDLRSPDPVEAIDAVLAEEFGPAVEPANPLNRHAAWLGTLARRQTHRPDASGLDRAALAVDLLLADR